MKKEEEKIFKCFQSLQEKAQDCIEAMRTAITVEQLDQIWACYRTVAQVCDALEIDFGECSELPVGIRILPKQLELEAMNAYQNRLNQLTTEKLNFEGDK